MIDLDALVIGPCLATFGEAVRFSPADGVAFLITGVFDEACLEQASIEALQPSGVVNTRPVLGVQLSQFPVLPAQDDLLTIVRTGQSYQVAAVLSDGHGAAKLLLNAFRPLRPL